MDLGLRLPQGLRVVAIRKAVQRSATRADGWLPVLTTGQTLGNVTFTGRLAGRWWRRRPESSKGGPRHD